MKIHITFVGFKLVSSNFGHRNHSSRVAKINSLLLLAVEPGYANMQRDSTKPAYLGSLPRSFNKLCVL